MQHLIVFNATDTRTRCLFQIVYPGQGTVHFQRVMPQEQITDKDSHFDSAENCFVKIFINK